MDDQDTEFEDEKRQIYEQKEALRNLVLEELKKLKKRYGTTREKAAELAGIERQTLQEITTRRPYGTKTPTRKTLEGLERAFRLRPGVLVRLIYPVTGDLSPVELSPSLYVSGSLSDFPSVTHLDAPPVVCHIPGRYPLYETPAFKEIEQESNRRGYPCVMLEHHEHPKEYQYLLAQNHTLLKPIAYVIMPPRSGRHNDVILKQLGINCPVVSIDRTLAPSYIAIRPEQQDGAYSAAIRAFRSSQSKPDAVYLVHGDEKLESVRQRLKGYEDAISKYYAASEPIRRARAMNYPAASCGVSKSK
jgi:transcriptional regulator with XRE-family HTH domain